MVCCSSNAFKKWDMTLKSVKSAKKKGRVIFVNRGCDISGTRLFFKPILNCDSWVTFLLISLCIDEHIHLC